MEGYKLKKNVIEPVLSLEEKLKKDLNYIKNDIIALQNNGNYCKYSKMIHCITCVDVSKSRYINYWTSLYLKHPNEQTVIKEACLNKLKNGLTDRETMIELVKKSKDTEKEKLQVLNFLKSKGGKK